MEGWEIKVSCLTAKYQTVVEAFEKIGKMHACQEGGKEEVTDDEGGCDGGEK